MKFGDWIFGKTSAANYVEILENAIKNGVLKVDKVRAITHYGRDEVEVICTMRILKNLEIDED